MRQQLRPYFGTLWQAITRGFTRYHEDHRDNAYLHSPRTRASTINDYIVASANDLFSDRHPELVPLNAAGRKLFEVPNSALLHFKKLNSKKLSSNYPTLFALNFNRQLDLPGLPAVLPRLIVGYEPTVDWTAIRDIYITCPDGENIAWHICLTEEVGPAIQTFTPAPNEPPKTQRRVKPRHDRAERSDAATREF